MPTDRRPSRPSGGTRPAPLVGAPTPLTERRASFRRSGDQLAARERTLLALSLDILAMDLPAEMQLAGILGLLARTAGARRAAVLAASHGQRRVAVCRADDEPPAAAEELAAWLDAWAPRPREHRAAEGPAPILVVSTGGVPADPAPAGPAAPGSRHFACLPIPGAGDVALGFDYATAAGPATLDQTLPPELARHAAVALALVTGQIAKERELETLRAREDERSRFVSTVAHELRTPLTGLAGYLDLIVGGQVPDAADQRDFLERSRDIVNAMTELVGDLLDLSRLESGSLSLVLEPFSPAEVAATVADRLAPIALDRQVQLRLDLPPRLRSATGDRRAAEQILTNLVGNALKFAPEGSAVEVVAWGDAQVALTVVRDEGSGISADDRSRIFDRFYRMAAHDRVAGTGLGLPIARELARAMGGDLDVASVPRSGSAFVLALPGATGADPADIRSRLESALVDEEVRLEERAVLRAMAARTRLDASN